MLTLARPLFRYSAVRGAYVLRIGGGTRGPVLVERDARRDVSAVFVPSPPPGRRFARRGGSEVSGASEMRATPGEDR